MKLLRKVSLCDVSQKSNIVVRQATRAICIDENKILLLYTQRYDDYSLPGGGVDPGETLKDALKRELNEETGALNIGNIKEFGRYEEYRSWTRQPGFDVQHMISYCYTCTVDSNLGTTSYEDYEISNNMRPVWIDINEAILHNEDVILNSSKVGLSIQRETFLLKLIKEKLL